MKTPILLILLVFLLSSCNGWVFRPGSGPTPFLPPTPTPRIHTPTPVVIGANTSTPAIATLTSTAVLTTMPSITDTAAFTPTATLTGTPGGPAIAILILGCDTSVDVTHGMGEVTNAYVTLKNTGGVELSNI